MWNRKNIKYGLLFGVLIGSVFATPMYYKKNENDTYEPGMNEC